MRCCRFQRIIIFALSLFCAQGLSAFCQEVDFGQEINNLFSDWDKPDSPGVGVVVVRDGEVIFKNTYGLANLEYEVPFSSTTRSNIGSVSKQFAALAILKLEMEGKLRQDDEIHTYIPELPAYDWPVTIYHLLHQTSGLPDFGTLWSLSGRYGSDFRDFQEVLRLFRFRKNLLFQPGSDYAYSNTNYAFLAEIVQRVSGKPFHEWMKENIFEPLGMHDTMSLPSRSIIVDGVADNYRLRGTGYEKYLKQSAVPGCTLIYTTLDDLAKWLMYLYREEKEGTTLFDSFTAPGKLNDGNTANYACGLILGAYKGVRFIRHSGQDGGYVCDLIYCPEHKLGVVVMGNCRQLDPNLYTENVIDTLLKDYIRTSQTVKAVDANAEEPATAPPISKFDALLGTYTFEEGNMKMALFRSGEQLFGAIYGMGISELYPKREGLLTNDYYGVEIAFSPTTSDGTAAGVNLRIRGTVHSGEKIDIPALDSESSAQLLGDYYCEELDVVYKIAQSEGRLFWSFRLGENPMARVDGDLFVNDTAFFSFERDDAGQIVGFSMRGESFGSIPFRKIYYH